MAMPLDAEIARVVDQLGEAPYLDLAAMPLAEAMIIARAPVPAYPPASPELTIREVQLEVEGGRIELRCYTPPAEGLLPIVVHLHGGGWVTGSLPSEDARCQFMALRSGCVVVSVGYRLSPETRFPLPVQDSIAAWDWACANAGSIGGDAKRMAVSGSSAGGQLAVAILLTLRRDGRPMAQFQLLTYPAIDPLLSQPSYAEFADGPFMTRARMAWYWDQYLAGADRHDLMLGSLTADLSGLPPALVQVAEMDVLRDEGVLYAERLRALGVEAEVSLHKGMIHGFIAIAPNHPQSTVALEEACTALRRHLL